MRKAIALAALLAATSPAGAVVTFNGNADQWFELETTNSLFVYQTNVVGPATVQLSLFGSTGAQLPLPGPCCGLGFPTWGGATPPLDIDFLHETNLGGNWVLEFHDMSWVNEVNYPPWLAPESVPSPPTLPLVATGLGLMAMLTRRQRRPLALAISALVLGVIAATQAQATTIIDTTTAPTSNGFSPFSDTGTTTYGEIFTVSGPDNFLTNFSLYLIDKPSGGCVCGTLAFKGYLGAWDGQKVADILYSSPIQTMTANFTLADVEFDFHPDVKLGTGQYIAFLSTAGLGFQGGHAFVMPFGNDLQNGGFAFTGNHLVDFGAQDFSALTTTDWDCVLCDEPTKSNVWFKATLTEAVPTPATLPLFATGLGLMAWLARRRRTNVRAQS